MFVIRLLGLDWTKPLNCVKLLKLASTSYDCKKTAYLADASILTI